MSDGAGGEQGRYLIALGSNRPHHRFGPPRAVLPAALDALVARGADVIAASSIVTSAPLGPSRRRYANAAAVIAIACEPLELLALLQSIEHAFGRDRGGQRWAARVLDLDIVLWSGGAWGAPGLTIPHPSFRARAFVLAPAKQIAADWRDPLSGLTIHHLYARLTRACLTNAGPLPR